MIMKNCFSVILHFFGTPFSPADLRIKAYRHGNISDYTTCGSPHFCQ